LRRITTAEKHIDGMSCDRIPEKMLKILTKKMFGKTSEMTEGFCCVIFITYLSRPDNT
jgi:hypothetical protein